MTGVKAGWEDIDRIS